MSKGISRLEIMPPVLSLRGFVAAGMLLWTPIPGNARRYKQEGAGTFEGCVVEQDLAGQEKELGKIGFPPCRPQQLVLLIMVWAKEEERAEEVFYSMLLQV